MLAKVVDPVQSDSVDPSIANFASVTWLGRLSDSNTFDAVFGPCWLPQLYRRVDQLYPVRGHDRFSIH